MIETILNSRLAEACAKWIETSAWSTEMMTYVGAGLLGTLGALILALLGATAWEAFQAWRRKRAYERKYGAR